MTYPSLKQITLQYYTPDDIKNFSDLLLLVIKRNGLEEGGSEIVASALVLGDYYRLENEFVRIYNSETSDQVDEFILSINKLLKYENETIEFRIKEKGQPVERKSANKVKYEKPWEVTFKSKAVTNWLIMLLRNALVEGRTPIELGMQLWDMKVVQDPITNIYKFNMRDRDPSRFEPIKPKVIIADTIAKISVEMLAVMHQFTKLKFQELGFSAEQLYFLVEVLITLGFYKSSDPDFKTGFSEPTLKDKRWIYSLLNRKLEQGKITFKPYEMPHKK